MALTEEQQQMVDQQIAVEDHRMTNQTAETAKQRKLKFVDATCPLVTKVHNEAVKF